jgi:di/tricarboxylate transporter
MSFELVIVLLLLCAAIVMFAINKPRMDAVALIMLTALPLTGVVSMNEALSGFSDSNIVLIAALFVIGDGLVRTGVARRLGDWLTVTAGNSEVRLLVLLMLVVCGLGATMSSTAVTAIFIPVALRISKTVGIAPSRLMMPISFAALISGMMTLIATAPNLVVNSELVRHGVAGFGFFSFTPFGAPILVLGIVYMVFASRWLGGADDAATKTSGRRPRLTDWNAQYNLAAREFRVRVRIGSPLAGKSLAEIRLRDQSGANLIAIDRNGTLIQPTAQVKILAGDILFIDLFADNLDVDALRQQYELDALPMSEAYFTDRSQEIGMVEVVVPSTAEIVGMAVADADLRDRFGLTAVGLRRGAAPQKGNFREERIKEGDTLLLIGGWRAIRNLQSNTRDLVVINLPVELDEVIPVPGRAAHAFACLVLVIGLMVSGVVPNVQAALIGCLLMGALGCVNLATAYRSIDWKTIVLIVGMLPFSTALERTGGVELATHALMSVVGGAGRHAVLASLFAITAVLGMFISNTATAVLMAPIALAMAADLHVSPHPFAMIVALAASTAFMTPVSSPVNTLVVGPGNYAFGDFVKVGLPFSLIVLIVSVILVPILLPF